jgi:hypothetical protein
LLDAEFFLPNSKRKRLENSWPGVFRQEIFPVLLEIEPEFARFYHPTEGAPNKAAAVMLGLNILQDMFDLSDGEVVEAFDFNAQWHYALETSPDLAHVCAKTLYTFRRFLTTDEMARRVFERATDRFIEKWNVRTTRHRLDSTHILSNVSRLSRVGLFVKTIEQFLKRLKRKSPELLAALPSELRERYLERKGYFADVKGSRAQRRLEQCAEDLWLLVERFRGRKSVASLQAYRNLARLFDEQCVVETPEEERTPRVALKVPKEVASDSLQNPSDPDATFSGHKGVGYQAQIAETCHEENALQLIDYAQSEGAHESDLNAPGRVHENLSGRGHAPKTTYADAGYISGKNIIEAEGQGVDLQGPTELGKRPKADKAPLSDFEFTAERTRVEKCPAGHEPIEQKDSKDGETVNAYFDKDLCERCERKSRCRAQRQLGRWVLRFTSVSVAVVQRRIEQETSEFKTAYKIRSGIEATNSQLKNQRGMHRLRVRGSPAVSLRVTFKCLAENCTRVLRHALKEIRETRIAPTAS